MSLGLFWSGFTSPAGHTLKVVHIYLTMTHKDQTQASRETNKTEVAEKEVAV